MTISIESDQLLAAVHQLRQISTYLEGMIPCQRDGHLPQHQRLEYITRSRTFADAATKDRAKKKG